MASTSCVIKSPLAMKETGSSCGQYPPPMATYEEVVDNPKLFLHSLEKLHATMGTKFMIPIIGGKELDLHRLFVEVTSRGGIEKIIKDRKWKDITLVFNFPSTATNASFVLRKYYTSLLYHYEQIYYFKAHNWTHAASDVLQSPPSTPVPALKMPFSHPSSEVQPAVVQPLNVNAAGLPEEQHVRLKPLNQGKDREISRTIGELWNKLNESEKAQGRTAEAEVEFERLLGVSEAKFAISQLSKVDRGDDTDTVKFSELLHCHHSKVVFIGSTLFALQQLSGINAVFYFSSTVFKSAGVPSDVANVCIGDINDHSSHRSKFTFTKHGSSVPICWWHANVCNFLVGLLFLRLLEKLGPQLLYSMFATFCMMAVIFVKRNVVETKGKSLQEIEIALLPQD
ncbi:hypothetical protein KIW84_033577 [Lathyrus oleraceus]|uniref:ARID domain-containing protein n=1 Tax=Pisum sativum TaxID=3888 RepID=A0A9D4XWZ0_PEA|nr:hypothetical protein KIW84_033577 [Pisum sativum]